MGVSGGDITRMHRARHAEQGADPAARTFYAVRGGEVDPASNHLTTMLLAMVNQNSCAGFTSVDNLAFGYNGVGRADWR